MAKVRVKVVTVRLMQARRITCLLNFNLLKCNHKLNWKDLAKSGGTNRPLYNTRPARRRLICVVGMAWFGQYSGQAIVGYFLPLMAKTAGIANVHTDLLINALHPVVTYVASVCGASMTDRWGRRALLLYSIFLVSVCFVILTGLGHLAVDNHNQKAGYAMLVFLYLYVTIFSFGWTPLQAM